MLTRVLILCLALAACSPAPKAPSGSTEEPVAPAAAPAASELTLDTIAPGVRLSSPARITGVAPSSWYFEAVLQAKLLGPDGHVIAEGPAQAQTDWTKEGPVPFIAELSFDIPADQPATLMLAEDMYGSEDHPDATRVLKVPVLLVSAKK